MTGFWEVGHFAYMPAHVYGALEANPTFPPLLDSMCLQQTRTGTVTKSES